MRAILAADPAGGAGYGILQIFDLGDANIVSVIIRRMADGKTLAPGGWRQGSHDLAPRRVEAGDNSVSLWFGPEVIDDLELDQDYEVELPGIGAMPIDLAGLRKSKIVTPNGAGAWPSPPEHLQEAPEAEEERIYEGAEATPLDRSGADADDMPTGVASCPDATPQKRKGCFLLASTAFIIWAAGAWLLWQWSINLPPQPDKEESAPFELLPRAEGS